ncbi:MULTISPECIES: biotin--[acetyl-CoA-carboxylase] ligase [Metabacillus]|uniref:Biotin--[acetyl-CoA-carboxylase] ligase n=1 Tax=Metabacillus hrfriensis TaxID=3048891 RepID=A0ACD4R738_9BACI|nr:MULTISPECIES: biotin--[acetyl-CoA-carboxylase] ligase [Metabacillus]UAL50788.1 biotin--[acetyl-CoA-carboxylase] ligase [Metabacillus dongyingensis]UOK56840.1 biotin--[acetyl-CoA-carboxylase] ligase [Bacillus sp. OVS6]USK27063.1 biotin--[acetyl-CoA-carboxylase] ligase [Bacillus sp. CMF21]WHZ56285.1 biotin--[acetyl-CoA-carboxylase] ligase [Metabacillus sp. CT-WN-B3]
MQSDLRTRLLQAFSEAEGEFLSGQKLSETLGCSRTAVWKHIEDLRSEGYELEAVRKRGYRITYKPDKISGNEIQLGLKTEFMGRHIHFEEVLSSTQKIAHTLAGDGAKEGTIVVADQQTSGRGRLARAWYSPKQTGIWMSMILRPKIPINKTPQLTLLTAVALIQAIEEVTGLTPEIKWPNDILINGKKIVGILTELQAEADRVHSVIIGVGMNVNHTLDQFPEELQATATSIAAETGEQADRAQVIQAIMMNFEKLYTSYLVHGFKPVKLLWESYAISLNKNLIARTLQGTIRGRAIGIDDEGVLLLETNEGNIEKIYSADIEIQS